MYLYLVSAVFKLILMAYRLSREFPFFLIGTKPRPSIGKRSSDNESP
jgi:hypothetical protein